MMVHSQKSARKPPPFPPLSSLASPSGKRVRNGSGIKFKVPTYSRFVAMMKIVLPAMAVVLIGLIVIWPQISGQDGRFNLGFSDISTSAVDKLSMVNARYFGTDTENQPFTVTADLATEAEPGSRVVELKMPKADISLSDGTWLVLGAEKGFYSQKDSILDLVGGVNLFHDQGYELHTAAAQIDMKAGIAGSDSPVSGQGPFGTLEAEGFRLMEKGSRIFFTGKIKIVLYPQAGSNLR